VATPAPVDAGEDESLVFMTHAPGAIVPPREEFNASDSFAGKILGKFGIAQAKDEAEGEASKTLSGRIAKGAVEGAGRGALDRALTASKRSKDRQEAWANKSWAGQNVAAPGAPQVVTGSPAGGASAQGDSGGFLASVLGAFMAPLRGLPVTIITIIMVAMALLMLELSPPLGLVACLISLAVLVSLRVQLVREACAGRTRVLWPSLGSFAAAWLPYLAAGLLVVPTLGLALAAYGSPAWTPAAESSVPARAQRLIQPKASLDTKGEGVHLGHNTYAMLEAVIGEVGRDGPPSRSRPTAEVARGVRDAALARGRTLVDVKAAAPLGLAARALALLTLIYAPMALLCAVRLRSAYAALHAPLILRSVARTAPGYLLVVVGFAVQLGLLGAALVLLPGLIAPSGAGGHAVWVMAVATALVVPPMVLADFLGRLYRANQIALGWD
jgi:hypothetical protein